jgi:hypothetical protein
MLRKALAMLLILSWVVLSGFDLLEDLELPSLVSVQSPIDDALPNIGQRVKTVNNLLESGDRTRPVSSGLRELPIVDSSIDAPGVPEKVSKIHKLHRIFLI